MRLSSAGEDDPVLVVGGGVSGLGAALRLARAGRPVVVAEALDRPGGYARSITHEGVTLDPAFGIFGGAPYPNFVRLLGELGVEARPLGPLEDYVTRYHPGGGAGWHNVGAIPYARHVVPELHRLVRDLAPRFLEGGGDDDLSIGDWLDRQGFSPEFACYVLVGGLTVGFGGHPLEYYLGYPARDFLKSAFFPGTQQPLLRLARGAEHYVDRFVAHLTATGRAQIRCGVTVRVVSRDDTGVTAWIDGKVERFSALVLTPRPSRALEVLADSADDQERDALGRFTESDDELLVHRDASFLPPDRSPRSFAYLQVPRPEEVGKAPWYAVATRRWLDNDDGETPAYITHDYRPSGRLEPRGARSLRMPHVRYDRSALRGRALLAALQGRRRTWFAGGHLRGQMLHEDALVTGYEAAAGILGRASQEPILVRGTSPAEEAPRALFLDAFADVVRRWPDRPLLTWLDDAGAVAGALTAAELDRRSRAVAGALTASGVPPGARALLVYPPGLDFVVGLLGCLRAGVVAVPVVPPAPTGREGVAAFDAIADDCEPAVVLTCSAFRLPALLARGRRAARSALSGEWRRAATPWITTDALPEADPSHDHRARPDDVALLQYTSGSTGTPRGVCITHGNLRHQLDAVNVRSVGITSDAVLAWWVPQYHDFGLIGGVLAVLYAGARGVVSSPLTFLKDPASWLVAASRYGATHTAAPDFAFAIAAARTSPDGVASLDLRRLKVVMSAGEPIRSDHVDAFLAKFAPAGLAPEAFCPAYGLAEHTVGVSVRGSASLHVDPRALEIGRQVRRGEHCLIGCGAPAPGVSVAIVDPATRRRCLPGEVGEIWIDGPSKAAGYWGRPEESAAVFCATLADEPGAWLRTGDEGFLHDGELFVTGRLKDLIVIRGRNLHPQDLEATVERHFAEVRRGRVAVFGVAHAGGEGLCVAAELRAPGAADPAHLAEAIAARVAATHGVAPATVVLVQRGGVPKTTSGKLQRRRCRALLEEGALAVAHRWDRAAAPVLEEIPARDEGTAARVARIVYERTRVRLGPDDSLAELAGVDSMAAVELTVRIQEEFSLPADWVVEVGGVTLAEVAGSIDAMTAGAPSATDPGVVVLREGQRPPLFLAGPLFLGRAALSKLAAALPRGRAVVGLLGDDSCHDALAMARAHVRRVVERQPTGPWHLAGYSYGGAVVHLVARLLDELHHAPPATVFLLDPLPPAPRAPGDLARLFLRAASSSEVPDGELGTEALHWFHRLVDPTAGPEDFARYLAARAAEIDSLSSAEVVRLASRSLACDLVFFLATDAPRATAATWSETYRRAEVIDLPHDHFRLLEASAELGRVLEARMAAAE